MGSKGIFSAVLTWKFWKDFIVITLAMSIAAAAIYYFLLPGNLVLGSVSGLAIVVSNLLAGVGVTMKVSAVVTIINALCLLLGYIMLGKEFGIKTAYASLVFGPLMDFWDLVLPYQRLLEPGSTSIMGDLWLDLLCFVLILSASQAILFRMNASTGGLDIPAKILNVYYHMDIGTSVTIAGMIICCTAFFVNPVRLVIVGIVGTWLNGLIVDYFTISLNKRKRVCIISDEYERIREYIVNTVSRGCSLYDVEGGYSGNMTKEIQSILTQDEFASLMTFIRENEIPAFITAGNVSEVYGTWSPHHRIRKGKKAPGAPSKSEKFTKAPAASGSPMTHEAAKASEVSEAPESAKASAVSDSVRTPGAGKSPEATDALGVAKASAVSDSVRALKATMSLEDRESLNL